MPRNASGTYTLPLPPVVPNTVIDSSWANDTMDDLAAAITNSLDRNGNGGMIAPFRVVDGTEAAPGFAYVAETGSGVFRETTGVVGLSILGTAKQYWTSAGSTIDTNLNVNGNLGVFGNMGVTGDVTIDGILTLPIGVVGNVLLPDGTAASPSLAFVNSLGSGLWWNDATDYMGFSVGGLERVRLDALGKLHAHYGLGVSSNGIIGVAGVQNGFAGSTGERYYRLQTSTNDLYFGQSSGVIFGAAAGAIGILAQSGAYPLGLGTIGPSSIIFGTNNTERMRLEATTPTLFIGGLPSIWAGANRATIELNGVSDALLGFKANGVPRGYLYHDGSGFNLFNQIAGPLNFSTNAVQRMVIDANGMINVNYPSPQAGRFQMSVISETSGRLNDFVFNNRGLNGTHTQTYDMGAIFATGYRDIADPAYCAAICFERVSSTGGAASRGDIVFRSSLVGETTKVLPEIMRINYFGIFDAAGIELGYKGIPQGGLELGAVTRNSRGKFIVVSANFDMSTAWGYVAGDTWLIVSNGGGAVTLASADASITFRLAGSYTGGPRTLAPGAQATLFMLTANVCIVSGPGVT